MSGYRMVVSVAQDFVAASALAERELHAWLDGKRYDVSVLEDGRHEIASGVTLDRDSASGMQGAYARWRLRETVGQDRGTWQSTLIVRADVDDQDHIGKQRSWIQLDVENLPSAVGRQPAPAGTPQLARRLLDVFRARDGLAEVREKPDFIEVDDIDEVIEELCDPERRLPIIIATVPFGRDPDSWSEEVVEPAFKPLAGLAVLYVVSPEAQGVFDRALGHHRVFGGGIRTYLPGVDPAWPADAERHPFMSRSKLQADPRRARATLAGLPQRLAQTQPLPSALDRLPVQRTRPRASTAGTEVQRLRSDNETLQLMLDEAEQRESARATEISQLRHAHHQLGLRNDELNAEHEELSEEYRRAQRVVQHLREQLVARGDAVGAYSQAPDTAVDFPESFSSLLDRLDELPHVQFTGNPKIACGLDDHGIDSWVRTAWEGLLALDEFRAACATGQAGSDFKAWCGSASPGRRYPFPAAKVARGESPTVANRAKWRSQRTFPVPVDVDPSGRTFMEAHLRIGTSGQFSPRLYFLMVHDRSAPIHIGYIGPHLDNTKTS